MNEYLKLFINKMSHFARPEFLHRYQDRKIIEYDRRLDAVEEEQREARMRLLEIQGTPRGGING